MDTVLAAIIGSKVPKHVGTFDPTVVYVTAREAATKYGGSVASWGRWIKAGACGTPVHHRNKFYVPAAAAQSYAQTKGVLK